MVERRLVVEAVEHGGHPPREVLGAPDAAQSRGRITFNHCPLTGIKAGKSFEKTADVGGAEIQAFAPVGGTMCAASPARNSRPYRIGSTTKLRIAMMPFWKMRPWASFQPSPVSRRACSSSQMRASGQFFTSSFGSHCR